ncbi:MAG: DUF305 domain-containing protein [Candidatus Buchananbacteria bacterium]
MTKLKYAIIGLVVGIVATFGVITMVNYSSAQINNQTNNNNQTQEATINPRAQINSLQNETGATFNQDYLVQMMLYHQMEMAISQIAVDKSDNADLRSFAQMIVDRNKTEGNKLIEWFKAWYGTSTVPTSTTP